MFLISLSVVWGCYREHNWRTVSTNRPARRSSLANSFRAGRWEGNRAIIKAWGQQLQVGFQASFLDWYNSGEALWFMFGWFIEQRERFWRPCCLLANLLSGHSSSLFPGRYFYLLMPLNHRIPEWIGWEKTLKSISFHPLPQTGTASTSLGCSKPCPWTLSGMRQAQFL